MKKSLIALALVAGCGAADQPADNLAVSSLPSGQGGAAMATTPGESPRAGLTTLTGLFEGGTGPQKNQLCMIEKGNSAQFGLVVWGGNMHSCSGSGEATRDGATLRLAMAGDSACTIDAKIDGETVTLPASAPAGCGYYCGARAQLGAAAFTRKGATAADAMKAVDLAGDPLCDAPPR